MDEDRIDALIVDCLDQPATEWGARIDALCARHEELAGELRRRFDKLIALGIVAPTEPAAEAGSAPDRLGHFRLLRRLGGGGMGVVYEAHDERLDRRVALKVIRDEQLFFADARERFARETRAATRLDHPNLCPIFDAGEIDGVPYIAMRYVEGRSLASLLDEHRRDRTARAAGSGAASDGRWLDAVALIEKIARALHTAHEAGLVHRDVKPGNVLIDAASGEPVLVDFGLASDAAAGTNRLTRTGERLGTPAYMAPEQVSGRGLVDRRADVYALGATLYECLTLHCPFESAAREELYHRILTEPPASPRAFDRSLTGELCVVLDKALEKDPKRRFATAAELAEELRRIREHEPILSRRPSAALRALRWCQRNRAAAGVLAATAIGLIVTLWLLRESTLSSRRYRALALLGAALEAEDQTPELAFRYAREAFRLHPDPVAPEIVASLQGIVFRLRQHDVIARGSDSLGVPVFSPDGRFLAVSRRLRPPLLFGEREGRWTALELQDASAGWSGALGDDHVMAVFSPQSDEVAFPGGSGSVHRYDLRGPAPRALPVLASDPRQLDPDGWGCVGVRYAPADGDRRILVLHVRAASLWSREGEQLGEPMRPFEGCNNWIDARFLPSGAIVAVGRLWSPDGRQALEDLTRGGADVCVGRDRFFVNTYPDGAAVQAFDFAGRPLGARVDLPRAERFFPRIALDRSGERLIVSLRSRLQLRAADTLLVEREWAGGDRPALSPDGMRIACDARNAIRIWGLDGDLDRPLDTLRGHEGWVFGTAWSPDGERLASAGGDGTVRIWTLEVRRGVPARSGLGWPDVAASPDGRTVVIASDARDRLLLCDAAGVRLDGEPLELDEPAVRFARDGRIVASASGDPAFWLWSPRAGGGERLVRVSTPVRIGSAPPEVLADGRWLLQNQSRRLFTWRDGESATLFSPLPQDGRDFAVSGDGTLVLNSATAGLFLRSPGGEVLWRSPEELTCGFPCVALSRDGRHVLAGGGDNAAYLWDVEDPAARPAVFAGHAAFIGRVAFSLDEALVATLSANDLIRVWDRRSGRTILQLRHEAVRRVVFTSTGQLVSAGRDGTVRWWWLDAASLGRALEVLDLPE